MARPRKIGQRRNGKLVYDKKLKSDPRLETAITRIRNFGVTIVQSVTPLAGHLAGVLYLRGLLDSRHLGHFYSYLQATPVPSGSIRYGVRVSGGRGYEFKPRPAYWRLTKLLGREINILHELANDRLICTVDRLREVLLKVPLTAAGSAYIVSCETHHPKNRSNRKNSRISSGRNTDGKSSKFEQSSARG